jgi:hypothetical protein
MLEAADAHRADAIGVSGLLVKSTVIMKEMNQSASRPHSGLKRIVEVSVLGVPPRVPGTRGGVAHGVQLRSRRPGRGRRGSVTYSLL